MIVSQVFVFILFCVCFLCRVLSQVYAPVLLAMVLKSLSLRVKHEKVKNRLPQMLRGASPSPDVAREPTPELPSEI